MLDICSYQSPHKLRQGENPCHVLLVRPWGSCLSYLFINFLCAEAALVSTKKPSTQRRGTRNAIVGYEYTGTGFETTQMLKCAMNHEYEYTTSPEQTGTIDDNKMCQVVVVLNESIAVNHYNPILAPRYYQP